MIGVVDQPEQSVGRRVVAQRRVARRQLRGQRWAPRRGRSVAAGEPMGVATARTIVASSVGPSPGIVHPAVWNVTCSSGPSRSTGRPATPAGERRRRGDADDIDRVGRVLQAQRDAEVGVGPDVVADHAGRPLGGEHAGGRRGCGRAGRRRRARRGTPGSSATSVANSSITTTRRARAPSGARRSVARRGRSRRRPAGAARGGAARRRGCAGLARPGARRGR